jgi:2'-5' RNA ligase
LQIGRIKARVIVTTDLPMQAITAIRALDDGTKAAAEPITLLAEVAKPPRVFVGLKIASGIAQQLAAIAAALKNESVRLVPGCDIHLTLVPPWNESGIATAAQKLQNAICGFDCFVLTFNHLRYGPSRHDPRMLWAECALSNGLASLQRALLAAFGQSCHRPFRPHVTLARIPKGGRAIARKHPMDQPLSFSQPVTSVELFQSPAKAPGHYQILASLPLGTKAGNAGQESRSLPRED